ncbi:MAG TPA: isochorismatase family protein [Alphaproteobacteria bacterium]|nr:isochorismatase family protein [Alphaproteobacteria bacterium]
MSDSYEAAGYNNGEIGYGVRPAVIVVDFQKAFTDDQYPLGGFEGIHDAVKQTAKLLEVARRCQVPVASCYTGYHSEDDMPFWKIDAVHDHFYWGHDSMTMDPRVFDAKYDFNFCKSAPSIFFETPLKTYLTKMGIDTAIITGCTTSGCIRASVIESFSHGYRTIIPEECAGDAEEGPHYDNLRDVGRRYADVTTLDAVIAYIEENRKCNAA